MSRPYDKLTIVLILGSIWGAYELFVREALSSLQVDHKSPYLFAFAVLIMYLSKKLVDFRGSAIVMALIASVYKTFSYDFLACMAAAVVIDGVIFEIAWRRVGATMERSNIGRSMIAIAMTFAAYSIFSIYAVFLGPAEFADGAGIRGVAGFLIHSALPAAILAAITMQIGNMLGTKLKSIGAFADTGLISFKTRTVLLLGSAAFWLARLLA